MRKNAQNEAAPDADHPMVDVEVTVDADDVAYVEALAQTLNINDELARQLRFKIVQILSDADDAGKSSASATPIEIH
jgi:hypothetical protein